MPTFISRSTLNEGTWRKSTSKIAAQAIASLLAVTSFATACGGTATDVQDRLGTSKRPERACISSGTEADINAVLVGDGAEAVLCPGAIFLLNDSVRFTAPNQKLYTDGLPLDGTRAILQINPEITGQNPLGTPLATAIVALDQPNVVIRSIQVDGSRPFLGPVPRPDPYGAALIQMGGDLGSNQRVQDIKAYNTRSWSTLHFHGGNVDSKGYPYCSGAMIINNTIGPAGVPGRDWADGISLGCKNSVTKGNLVIDATDGAIVLFGAPGSYVYNNTVVAQTRELLGGIALVDSLVGTVYYGNYTGTWVFNNTVDGQGAFIKVAFPMGGKVHCPGIANTLRSIYRSL